MPNEIKNPVQKRHEEKVKNSNQCYALYKKLASVYDRGLDVNLLGSHRIWRNRVTRAIKPKNNTKIIDMAAGTGLTTLFFINFIKSNQIKNCHITLCDINEHMLAKAKENLKAVNYDPNLTACVKGDIENSTFKDDSFDVYNVTFGLRYCNDYHNALAEAYRILKPGGQFFCLEFSHVKNWFFKWLRDIYFYCIFPILMFIGFKTIGVYSDLIKSFNSVPDQDKLKSMMEEAGFQDVTYDNVWFGVVAIHTGVKPKKN